METLLVNFNVKAQRVTTTLLGQPSGVRSLCKAFDWNT